MATLLTHYYCQWCQPWYSSFQVSSSQNQGGSGTFDWSAHDQGIILGAFFYGYIVTPVLGGFVAERYSAKWIVFTAMFLGSLCTMLSPVAALQGGKTALVVVKVIQGLVQVK